MIAINNAYQLAPWATVLYAADEKWWRWHTGVPSFRGLKFSLQAANPPFPDVQVLKSTGDRGLEVRAWGLRTGRDSGYQAINLAVHLGATRIVLLGYDFQRGPNGEHHWHADHPVQRETPFDAYAVFYLSLLEPLAKLGVTVLNATRRTKLAMFPKVDLAEALA